MRRAKKCFSILTELVVSTIVTKRIGFITKKRAKKLGEQQKIAASRRDGKDDKSQM